MPRSPPYVAIGSCSELQYLVTLAGELEIVKSIEWKPVADQCGAVARQLHALIEQMETIAAGQRGTEN